MYLCFWNDATLSERFPAVDVGRVDTDPPGRKQYNEGANEC